MRGDGCVQLLPSCWIRPAVVRRAVMEMFAWRAARVRFAWVGGWKVRAVVFRPAVARRVETQGLVLENFRRVVRA
jgi:hypothetical protein